MWDYIIIGAGTAGCVLAHELTSSERNKVLLVEAGGKPNLMVRIPAGFPNLFRTRLDWNFASEPQSACGGRIVYIPRGKMLGGSANMNAQVHQWCHPADFDGWAECGATGWSWAEVAPAFREMESSGCDPEDPARGSQGPMTVGCPAAPHPLAESFVEAARRNGLGGDGDYNGCAYTGAWLTEQANRKGCRFSVYDAYLKPAMRRSNLEVLSGALVHSILVEQGRAVGIRIERDGTLFEQRATRGVVLAAGAIGSPHLLMRSGLGPADQLGANGIPIVRDAPGVGSNLQDHPLAYLQFHMRRPVSMKAATGFAPLLRWLLRRRGLLATSGIDAFAFTNVSGGGPPDVELILAPFEARGQLLEPPQVHAYTLAVSPIAPKSRGTIRLKGPAATDPPAIDLGLLTDAGGDDARVLVAGARLARRIAATEPLASETVAEFESSASAEGDEQLLAFLKSNIQTVYHPAGTCRMGSDRDAVVDPQLRLRGLDGLWVADASAMPTVPRGHPNAVVAMIAYRAASFIQQSD